MLNEQQKISDELRIVVRDKFGRIKQRQTVRQDEDQIINNLVKDIHNQIKEEIMQ